MASRAATISQPSDGGPLWSATESVGCRILVGDELIDQQTAGDDGSVDASRTTRATDAMDHHVIRTRNERGHRHTDMSTTTTATSTIVTTHAVSKVYGTQDNQVHALRAVNTGINQGEFTAVMGPSGSGKSTLMHCMAGLDRPTSGTIVLGGTDITALSERQLTDLRRDRIGFVFQKFNLLSELSAHDNILLPLSIAGRRPDRDWVNTVIEVLGIQDRLRHHPSELSGGQQQRVAIARALANRPDVVFADEPTGNLDTSTGREVLAFLRRSTRDFGQTVVMVTHDPAAAAEADRVVLLADGRIAGELREPNRQQVLAALDDVSR
ncbi:Bacitracin export ATP-binding protein BceA [Actinoalloteichus hoggarensis]|uniref:Bacitracin export ATP-binding protein BceA n=2 Tax=Actinoalloteichus hoggarensis TaxID=1470176 RepID=A0A221VZ77_9PSEU|nr:Bacitracin export ATP-binding protein BceA [Actinoalloteichus hoggarensis]